MKNIIMKSIVIALALTMAAAIGACDIIEVENSNIEDVKGKDLVIASFVDLRMDKEGTADNPNLFYDVKQEYEKEYKSGVIFKLYNEQIFQNKLIQMIGSGNAPDLVYCGSLHLPRFAAMQLLQPIDDFMDPEKVNYKETADSLMWGGKHIAARVEQIQPYVIWYNKKIFQKNGLTEPYDLWKNGEWTFDKFREIGMALTQDTNNDGLTDQFGFDTSGVYTPMWANAGKWLEVGEDGNVDILWKEPAFYNAVKFYKDAIWTDGWWHKDPIAGYSGFSANQFAMIGEPFEFKFTYVKDMDMDLIGCAPWPEGPQFKDNGGKYYTACNILGIANRSKNPYGAAEFAKMMTDYEKTLDLDHIPLGNASAEAYLTEKDWEVLDYVRANALIDMHGWGEWTQDKWFYPIVIDNKDISTVLDSLEPVLRNEVNKTLSYKLPEIKPFSAPAMLTFENQDMGYLTEEDCVNNGLEIIAETDEVIAGKNSLKIQFGDTETVAVRSDPGTLFIPGYHTYRITFEWKITAVAQANKDIGLDCFVTLRPKSSLSEATYQAGYIGIFGSEGDSSTAFGEINLSSGMEDYCFVLVNGEAGSGEIVIDNIQIAEVPQ
ncbi:MAG: ABC transporter substrate-binding protein [Saccharofermentanales bacterium]